jgi:hypothetical protein
MKDDITAALRSLVLRSDGSRMGHGMSICEGVAPSASDVHDSPPSLALFSATSIIRLAFTRATHTVRKVSPFLFSHHRPSSTRFQWRKSEEKS